MSDGEYAYTNYVGFYIGPQPRHRQRIPMSTGRGTCGSSVCVFSRLAEQHSPPPHSFHALALAKPPPILPSHSAARNSPAHNKHIQHIRYPALVLNAQRSPQHQGAGRRIVSMSIRTNVPSALFAIQRSINQSKPLCSNRPKPTVVPKLPIPTGQPANL